MKHLAIALLLLSLGGQLRPARADIALILTESEKTALLEALDEATKAKGLAIAGNTLYLANKIKAAPVVTERKDDAPTKKDEER